VRHHESSIEGIPQKQYFYVSLGNNFLLFFCGGPLVVEALDNCPVSPPIKSGCGLWYSAAFAVRAFHPHSLADDRTATANVNRGPLKYSLFCFWQVVRPHQVTHSDAASPSQINPLLTWSQVTLRTKNRRRNSIDHSNMTSDLAHAHRYGYLL